VPQLQIKSCRKFPGHFSNDDILHCLLCVLSFYESSPISIPLYQHNPAMCVFTWNRRKMFHLPCGYRIWLKPHVYALWFSERFQPDPTSTLSEQVQSVQLVQIHSYLDFVIRILLRLTITWLQFWDPTTRCWRKLWIKHEEHDGALFSRTLQICRYDFKMEIRSSWGYKIHSLLLQYSFIYVKCSATLKVTYNLIFLLY